MNENFKEIRQLMLATNKIDGVYYFFAKKLGINENKLAVLGSHAKEKTICLTDKGVVYVKNIMKEVYEAEQAAMEQTVEKFSSEFVTAMGYFSNCLCNEFQKRKL